MKTFEAATKAMIDEDRELGHIGVDDPEWGRYESMLRAALIVVKERCASTPCEVAVNRILKGEI